MFPSPARLSAVALALLAGCGPRPPSTIEIVAFPTKAAAGTGVVELTMTGSSSGYPLSAGTTITVKTTSGSFSKDDADTQETTATVAGGKAEVKLYAPTRPETATVKAEYTDAYDQPISKTLEVEFTAPGVTRLDFRCFARNIMVFDHAEDLNIRCEAVATDATDKEVPTAVIRFGAEAGGIRKNDDGIWVYNPRIGDRIEPVDVAPLGTPTDGEPRWTDGDRVRNPRDGLVTVVAWVPGEGGTDGEPYIDVDDDNKYTEGKDIFTSAMDINENGERDEDLDTILWRKIRMVWSGVSCPPGTTLCKVTPSTKVDIPKGTTKKYTFTYVDRNQNVLAANDSESDGITWVINSGTSAAALLVDRVKMFFDEYGMNIDSRYELQNGDRKASYIRNATYDATVTNPEDADPMNPTPPGDITVSGDISRTRSVDPGGSPDQVQSGEITPVAQGRAL